MRQQPIVAACVLAVIALLLSGYRLRDATPTAAEITFNMHAQTVLNGKPSLFFHTSGEQWLEPLPIYLNAAVRGVGAGASSGRIVSAIAGALNVALVFFAALLITERWWIAAIAAVVLIFTPAHSMLAIRGTDAMLLSTLILSWLYCAIRFFKSDSLAMLSAAAIALGFAIYTHPAGPLTALFLWLLTITVAYRRNRARLLGATAAFAAMWIPAVAWFALHRDTYPDTFGRWFVFAAHLRNPVEGAVAFFNLDTLGSRASLYWSFWDPSWLFFSSPQSAAPVPVIVAPFIIVAVVRWPMHGIRDAPWLVIGSALVVPLAGASFGAAHYIADAAALLPILALLAAIGVNELVRLAVRDRPVEDDLAVTTIE
jgi:4-amino-4-deoxy-L-arabinose transferase-like glycosyltransferase